jgi:TolB-like protein
MTSRSPWLRGLFCALSAACLAPPGGAAAAETEAASGHPEVRHPVAVLDVQATGGVNREQVQGLSSFVITQATRRPWLDVISSADIRTVLGYEAERQLLGCEEDTACLAELGGALGATYLLSSEVSRVGSHWLFSVALVEAASARALARASERADSEDELLEVVVRALAEVLHPLTPAHVLAEAPPSRRRLPGYAWASLGAGVASAGAGGALYGLAVQSRRGWGSGDLVLGQEEARAVEMRAALGMGLMAAGTGAVVAGLVLPRLRPPEAPAGPTLAVMPLGDGWALSVGAPW